MMTLYISTRALHLSRGSSQWGLTILTGGTKNLTVTHLVINTQANKRTDGRYQTYYLPCFAVDNKILKVVRHILKTKGKKVVFLLEDSVCMIWHCIP